MPKHKHSNSNHMPDRHLYLLDTTYRPPISQALPRTTHCPRRRPRPPRHTREGVSGQVDRVVHDLVLGANLGGDPRDADRMGGGAERGERDADGERAASPEMRVFHER